MTTGQLLLLFAACLLLLAGTAYVIGRRRAEGIKAGGTFMNSQPGQYGQFAATWTAVPAIVAAFVGWVATLFGAEIISGKLIIAAAVAAAVVGLVWAVRQVDPELRARLGVERVITAALITASMVSILTTLGILLSIIFESIRFFGMVDFMHFVTGTEWNPDAAPEGSEELITKGFGSLPLFAGTFLITGIAMTVALPIGLLSAIYMSEYASPSVRSVSKPLLEILAGIPTVVYGFFAAITIAPIIVAVADKVGLQASYQAALAPGLVMGIMIIPFISSLSDDVINSVPESMRDGSLALGMTKSETIRHILIPAALPGIISATLLGVSRALGETMIVVMAAGLRPNLTWNPLEAVTTVTVRIVDALTGDQAFGTPETLAAFSLGLVLFVVTLILNIVSVSMVRRFKQQYA